MYSVICVTEATMIIWLFYLPAGLNDINRAQYLCAELSRWYPILY